MKVRCVANRGSVLPADFSPIGYFMESEFDILIDRSYVVYGMCLRRHVLAYLIDPEGTGRPNWYPVNLFEIEDNRTPSLWRFSFTPENQSHGVPAIWGYEELVNSTEHFDGLVERDALAISVFARRREEIDSTESR